MLNEQKYKRWAWGALIGLAVIIVVAGIIMAMSVKTPKPSETVSKANTDIVSGEKNEEATEESKTDDSTAKNDQKTETKPETTKDTTEDTSSEKQSNSGSVSAPATTTAPTTTTTTSDNIPKTGPEEVIIPILGLAAIGYLFAYNVALFKKNA